MNELRRDWRPGWPVSVAQIWGVWRRGAGDPTYRVDAGRHWRGLRTPAGAATLCVAEVPSAGVVRALAWGPGGEWALEHLPTMLGADDDVASFVTHHEALRRVWRAHPHARIGRGGVLMDALVPAIIEQKVTGHEAFGGFRRLVRAHGEKAPGPHPDLWVQPSPEALRRVPSWDWLRFSIDAARSEAILRVARVASSLERLVGRPTAEVDAALRSIPGVGVWTSAEVRSRALGDADAVSFGDYHVAKEIGWALLGRDLDDAELAEVLTPYAGHRYRVQQLVMIDGLARPRRGARMAPRTHLPTGR